MRASGENTARAKTGERGSCPGTASVGVHTAAVLVITTDCLSLVIHRVTLLPSKLPSRIQGYLAHKKPHHPNDERKHGLSTAQFPVSAYAGSSKNLKDLKDDLSTFRHLQGYLAYKQARHLRTLQYAYAQGLTVVLNGDVFL